MGHYALTGVAASIFGPGDDWSPVNLGSGLIAAYDLGDLALTTVDGSTKIQAAEDIGPNNLDMVPFTSAQGPPRVTVGGLTGGKFDTSFGYQLQKTGASLGGTTVAAFAMVRFDSTDIETNGRVASVVASADGHDYDSVSSAAIVIRDGTTNAVRAYRAPAGWLASAAISNDANLRLGGVFDGSNHKVYVNGVEIASVSNSGSFGSTVDLLIGCDNPDGAWAGGPGAVIGRILFMNRAPTSGELTSIDTWLQGT